ncbi:ABC transporter ATP-binding protein [Rhodalgimonas zhirmunskyi]|uniref:ABC transporter ATP-binding protein n=1 Tax=Rhodalgimonas zhirmunskyi TaxID=2964767 RepID=A0AAJ1X6W2_9RHOB|nr:ABC transporter ATP-binding protein [Rhodoalgimonas zhirmunskyi]MDQ2095614.1 ABC transporter ATP-binding protein [Rhodoalgimonas zhirmunskyi]
MTLLNLSDLSVTLRVRPVLSHITLDVRPGELIGLIGANGAGKTTLMRAALGLVPFTGRASLAEMTPGERGRHAAWMPQTREIAWPVSVEALVGLGRVPHEGRASADEDRAAVDHALSTLGLEPFRHRTATRLSGGEQARVLLARALAQETPLLMADEPIAGLDPAHQIGTMKSLAALARDGERGVIVSLHDLGLAARYCTRLVVLHQGRIAADGPAGEVLSPALIREVFGIDAFYEDTPRGPVFQPLDILGPGPDS